MARSRLQEFDPVSGARGTGGGPGGTPPMPRLRGGGGGGGAVRNDMGTIPTPAAGTPGAVPPTGSGAGAAAAGGGKGGTGMTNTAQISPYLKEQLERYKQRFSVDNTKRAIDKSTLGVMDAAALAAADAKAGLARRGVSGTGTADAFLRKRIFAPAQRMAAGNAATIAMGRETALDNLVLGGTGLSMAPDQIAQAQQGINLRQYEIQQQDAAQRAAATNAANQAAIAQWMALANMGAYDGGY